MRELEVRECTDLEEIKALFREYSQLKGAEGCFVSFGEELADLKGFYKGGALLIGHEDGDAAACIALRKIDEASCEAKRLYIRPAYRGRGYARIMLGAMLDKARELGFKEVTFTTRPDVMSIAYALYQRMGFEELSKEDGVVAMRMTLD